MGKDSALDSTIKSENGEEVPEVSYEDKLKFVSVIAKPMASRKFSKKVYKLIKKSSKQKNYLRSGLKDVQRRIRKGESGIVVFAGDVTPLDVMIHMPGVCEDKQIPYVYTPSRMDLGAAMGVKRGCLMMLVRKHDDYQDLYDEVTNEIASLDNQP
uniref:H/ACA snoRNP protein NHP2 n=1 Tax=Acartia pacifica TaxID=335913 RepID=A0A0U2URK4_ACAPC|nr:H/ACA ribonucleoprotein complex subunit 2-like protein [Acartia pacifica]ALS04175.1 H/ACA ribonucleoprotein complex subunit 2-like protein [Acartia pacifica]